MGDDELPIKRHWCEAMLGVLAYLDAHDLTRLMTCMRAGFSNVWHIGVFRAIDEYLASYKLGDKNLTKKLKGDLYSLVQYIKRKPHKYGHLFYLLCSKVFIPETNGDFVVFCSDFLSCHINPIRSPSDCFQLLVETRVLLAERPVYVADSAFFTGQVLKFLRIHDLGFILSGGSSMFKDLVDIAKTGLNPRWYRLYKNRYNELFCL